MDESKTSASSAPPTRSLRALLDEILDYAGSFPPAALPLSTALSNYAAYRGTPWQWLLARFVCPAAELADISDDIRPASSDAPVRFSLLASGGESDERFLTALDADLRAAAHFRREHGGRVTVEQIEARFPVSLLDADVVTTRRFLERIDAALDTADLRQMDVFLEVPLNDNLRQTLPVLAGAVNARNREPNEPEAGRFGIKMRTGGTASDDVPPAGLVAQVIVACRDADVPYKATAGLHHPVRGFAASGDRPMHGFLNVFGAAVLAEAHDLGEDAVADILLDTDPAHFRFSDDRLSWTNLEADASDIERVRQHRAISFGSCSFEEPVTDLRSLGYL